MFSNIQLITAGALKRRKGHHKRGSLCFTSISELQAYPLQKYPNYDLFGVRFPAIWVRHGYEKKLRCEIKFCNGLMPIPTESKAKGRESDAEMRRILRSVRKINVEELAGHPFAPKHKQEHSLIVAPVTVPMNMDENPQVKRAVTVVTSRAPETSLLRAQRGRVARDFVVKRGLAPHGDVVPFYGSYKLIGLLEDEAINYYAAFELAALASIGGKESVGREINDMKEKSLYGAHGHFGALFMRGYMFAQLSAQVKSKITGVRNPDRARKLAFDLGSFIEKNNL